MNKQRRKEIDQEKNNIKYLIEQLKQVKNDIERIQSDEQDYLDNMPENLQYSMRADDSQDAIDNLEDAIDSLDDAIDSLDCIF